MSTSTSKQLTVLLAGATGVIGRQLLPKLLTNGHRVCAMTRSANKYNGLLIAGALPLVCDVYDAQLLAAVVRAVRPDLIIHQLTDLPSNLDVSQMADGIRMNARIRTEGTKNLMHAAAAAGVPRVVAQSIAWAYAEVDEPANEETPLDLSAEGLRAVTVSGVAALEDAVLHCEGIKGVVLRYGRLYGPCTGSDLPQNEAPIVQIDAAIEATLLAVDSACSGIYNITEDSPFVSSAKARSSLGWTHA